MYSSVSFWLFPVLIRILHQHGVEVLGVAGDLFAEPCGLVEGFVLVGEFDFSNGETVVVAVELVDFPSVFAIGVLDEVQSLLEICEPGVIDKTRYLVKNTDGKHTWEVDEFYGDNDGLIVAEVELADENEPFDKPAWLGEEVTGDPKYFNSMLMKNPYKNW